MATNVQFFTLDQLVNVQLDYVRNNLPTAIKGPLGPVITAIAYATALVAIFLQRVMQQILRAARLTTAESVDVDTFVQDFGMSRSPGVAATGTVTFSRIVTAVTNIRVPIDSFVQTESEPPIRFRVVADTSSADYSDELQAYLILPGLTSCEAKVVAVDVGESGNVQAGAITQIASSLPGVDNVVNDLNFVNGADIETDDMLRVRFALYIQSLSRATQIAVSSAVINVRPNVIFKVTENTNLNGGEELGQFVVAVDDGSGNPPVELLDSIASAVDVVRPVAVRAITISPERVVQTCAHIIVAYDPLLVFDLTQFSTVITSRVIEYVNTLNFLDVPRLAQVYRTIWDSVSPGDVVEVEIADNSDTTTNVLFLTSTTGLVIGQSLEVEGVASVTGRLPRIIAIEVDESVVISPPLVTIPLVGTIVRSFSLRRQQILNINDMGWEQFVVAKLTDATSVPAGYGGTAITGTYAGVTGLATKIYLEDVTGISDPGVVTDQVVHFISKDIQADPTVGTDYGGFAPRIVQKGTTDIIVQPVIGQLASDGTWNEIQSTQGVGPFLDDGESVSIVVGAASEAAIEPTPISTSIAKVFRSDAVGITIVLTPNVG